MNIFNRIAFGLTSFFTILKSPLYVNINLKSNLENSDIPVEYNKEMDILNIKREIKYILSRMEYYIEYNKKIKIPGFEKEIKMEIKEERKKLKKELNILEDKLGYALLSYEIKKAWI